jgi:hypothetical protein
MGIEKFKNDSIPRPGDQIIGIWGFANKSKHTPFPVAVLHINGYHLNKSGTSGPGALQGPTLLAG